MGSIAEEALKLNGVFEAAQRAADKYLSSIRRRYEEEGHLLTQEAEQFQWEQDTGTEMTEEEKPLGTEYGEEDCRLYDSGTPVRAEPSDGESRPTENGSQTEQEEKEQSPSGGWEVFRKWGSRNGNE